jgi:hypothetical protein
MFAAATVTVIVFVAFQRPDTARTQSYVAAESDSPQPTVDDAPLLAESPTPSPTPMAAINTRFACRCNCQERDNENPQVGTVLCTVRQGRQCTYYVPVNVDTDCGRLNGAACEGYPTNESERRSGELDGCRRVVVPN